MELRRIHSPTVCDHQGKPIVTGVDVFHTGLSPEQNWDQGQVLQYASEGWLRLEGDQIVLAAEQDTLRYDVLRRPGYYVRSTGERIPISELAMQQFMTERVATLAPAEARAFLAGKGLAENDYEASRIYRCCLTAEQHEKWRAVRDIAGNVVAAHTLEG